MHLSFTVEGKTFRLEPGRELPGLPALHIVDDSGGHVSLAYPLRSGAGFLFDTGHGKGFYLDTATGKAEPYPSPTAYYEARQRSGWPIRKRRRLPA